MKSALRLVLLSALLAIASNAFATIRFVSPNPGSAPHSTITQAWSAAATGDTIVIGPGNYSENLNPNGKRIHFIGAGWDVCTWTGVFQVNGSAASGTTFEGIRFLGGGYYTFYNHSSVDSVTYRRCNILSIAGYVPLYLASGRTYVTDCVLHSNGGQAVYMTSNGNMVFRNTVFNCITQSVNNNALNGPNGGTVEIYNCVFLNFVKPFEVTGIPQVIGLNNIFWDWGASPTYGTLPVGSVFEYTASGSGAPAFPASFTTNISLGANNPFVTYDNTYYTYPASNLHLNGGAGGLLCVDAGYPSILDLDSSPSDLGVYGGPKPFVDHGVPAYPFALTLSIDNLVEVGDSVNVTSSGRIGPRY